MTTNKQTQIRHYRVIRKDARSGRVTVKDMMSGARFNPFPASVGSIICQKAHGHEERINVFDDGQLDGAVLFWKWTPAGCVFGSLPKGSWSHGTLIVGDVYRNIRTILIAGLEGVVDDIPAEVDDPDWDDVEDLERYVNELLPDDVYFGIHPGDGSDFGVWVDDWYHVPEQEGESQDSPSSEQGSALLIVAVVLLAIVVLVIIAVLAPVIASHTGASGIPEGGYNFSDGSLSGAIWNYISGGL